VVLAGVLVVGGAPLVARALADDSTPENAGLAQAPAGAPSEARRTESITRPSVSPVDAGLSARLEADPATTEADVPTPAASPEIAPEPTVDPVIVLLAGTYAWGESAPRVVELQETLGVVADGVYGHATLLAHRNALEFVALPTDTLPMPEFPAGPSPEEWEALRQCESNGNYAITNPSGKYRGAYQFDRTTWDSVAGRHAPQLAGVDPAAASPADQDFMASALYSERGARPWPHCGRHLS
jgi:hypothetical protein